MKHYWTYVVVPNDQDNGFSFIVRLKNNTRFILNECYFTIKKTLFDKNPDSDYFFVETIAENNKKNAEIKIRRAVDMLTYITGIPYELGYIEEDEEINIVSIDINYSREKIARISAINQKYGKIKSKKELLENTLRLYALSVRYTIILSDAEEAYFACFRILEKIAKDEFGIEKNKIAKGSIVIKNMIKTVLEENYKIKMPTNKIDDLAGNMASELFDTVFSDVYAKIAWFCAEKRISYDEEVLAKAVKMRNALAHGEMVEIDYESAEYMLIDNLAKQFIREKFFTDIKKCYLEAEMNIDGL